MWPITLDTADITKSTPRPSAEPWDHDRQVMFVKDRALVNKESKRFNVWLLFPQLAEAWPARQEVQKDMFSLVTHLLGVVSYARHRWFFTSHMALETTSRVESGQ